MDNGIRPLATVHMLDHPTLPVVDEYNDLVARWKQALEDEQKTMEVSVYTDSDPEKGELLVKRIDFIFELTADVWRARQEDQIEANQARTEFEDQIEKLTQIVPGLNRKDDDDEAA